MLSDVSLSDALDRRDFNLDNRKELNLDNRRDFNLDNRKELSERREFTLNEKHFADEKQVMISLDDQLVSSFPFHSTEWRETTLVARSRTTATTSVAPPSTAMETPTQTHPLTVRIYIREYIRDTYKRI